MKTRIFTLILAFFAFTMLGFSQSTREFMHLTDGHYYIIKSVINSNKVMTIRNGYKFAKMENYVAGDSAQMWHVTEQYPNSPVWFYFIDNKVAGDIIHAPLTFNYLGNLDHNLDYTKPFKGWNMEWNDDKTAVRMCNFFERWNNGDPNANGCFMTDSMGVKVVAYIYKMQTNGVYDGTEYSSVTDAPNQMFFDFTMVDTNTLQGLNDVSIVDFGLFAHAGNIVIDRANGLNISILSIDGRTVKQIKSARSQEVIAVQKGTYIVWVSGTAKKVIVN
ncbi:MAG: DUF6383 domain-containing protein [Paludibacter sp.]|nr:DUF6383 domain-containing protein [Paludibacter sp.]